MKFFHVLARISVFIGLTACNQLGNDPAATYIYQLPEQFSDGWSMASLKSQQVDPKPIEDLTNQILREQYHKFF
ncbi:hypothetical protein [Spirosoma radiotolerans]|uniref:Uncharacterized protein n=1 Tax=Spirosoma radiotolerans TaxID=1379870 RepID=A0A0E3V9I0_9BACT|nr:hypothetical protein [Spirosoma radiotolerans]AKD57161.1 hypothetical protein SD10_21955 [Spirosoma radiotolerans]